MNTPSYISGNRSIAANAKVILGLTDSICSVAWRDLPGQFDEMCGVDDTFGRLIGSPNGDANTSLLADSDYANYIEGFDFPAFAWLGQSTLASTVSSGVNTITINAPANGQGLPCNLMVVTLNPGGGNQEVVTLTARLSGYTTGSNTFVFRTNTVNSHTAGELVKWQRPSGLNYYWPNSVPEYLLLAGTYTSPSQGGESRYFLDDRWFTGGQFDNGTDGTQLLRYERYFFRDGDAIGSGKVRITRYYLAHPNGLGDFWNHSAFSADHALFDATTPTASAPFSDYAAVPTIKSVSVDMPAPANYEAYYGVRCRVTLRGTTTVPSGKMFIPLKTVVQRIDPNGNLMPGPTWILLGQSGYGAPNFSSIGALQYGPNVSANFAQQFVTAAAVDTLLVELGDNYINVNDTDVQIKPSILDVMANYSPASNPPGVILLSSYKLAGTGSSTLTVIANAGSNNTITLGTVAGIKAGTEIRLDDATSNIRENVYAKSVSGLVVTLQEVVLKQHAIGATAMWFVQDATLDWRVRQGPYIQAAFQQIVAANPTTTLFFDGYAGLGSLDHIANYYIANINEYGTADWLHPQSRGARTMWNGFIATCWKIAALTSATSLTSVQALTTAISNLPVPRNVSATQS